MKTLLTMAFQSLWNRRFTTILTLLSITLSVCLLLSVERVRTGAQEGFRNTISGTDLLLGTRSGPVQLLLYTVFHLGSPVANVSWSAYNEIKDRPEVEWMVPMSLGDSHRGYRVVGTTTDYFKHYQYRRQQGLSFAEGKAFTGTFDAVIGAQVAAKLGYEVDRKIVLAHGIVEDGAAFQKHDDKPFTITGILAPTGTPVDRSVFVTLAGIEAIHIDWQDGGPPMPGNEIPADQIQAEQLVPTQITAALIGARSKFDILNLQRAINEFEDEPLQAVIPGVALSQLWNGLSYAENALLVVAVFVVIVGFLGMLVAIYNSLNERRREMAILRSVGAGPGQIFVLLVTESLLLTIAGAALGLLSTYGLIAMARPLAETSFGLDLPMALPSAIEWSYLSGIIGLGLIMGAVPAWRAYRNTLADGLTIRL